MLASAIPAGQWRGRWFPGGQTGSMKATWTSASISFFFTGTHLSFQVGNLTQRKDKDNGGTPMLAVLTGPTKKDVLGKHPTKSRWRSVDPQPGSAVVIFGEGTEDQQAASEAEFKTFVRIVMIDWASIFELCNFMTSDVRVLYTGLRT